MDLEKRLIGRSSVEVTTLGFGGAPLGAVGDRLSLSQAQEVLQAGIDGGIRYFDTAPLYGHGLSEKRLGTGLQTLDRADFVLSSKVGRLLVPSSDGERYEGMRDNEPFSIRYDYSYDAVRRSLESSLERLGLDRVDILLCHDIDVWTHGDDQSTVFREAINGAIPAMQALREEGIVRAIGLGVNESAVCVDVMQACDVDCFLLAGRFTLLEQEPLDELLPQCTKNNVSIIIGGPYNSGLLANADRQRATYDYKPVSDSLWDKAVSIRSVCGSYNVDIRAAALQYPLRHPAVAAVIPGMWKVDEVSKNIELFHTEIPSELWRELAAKGLSRPLDD